MSNNNDPRHASKKTTGRKALPVKRPEPLTRIDGTAVQTAQSIFGNAVVEIVPDALTQRRAFSSLMPHLMALRKKGCSWKQITNLLNQCTFNLQPSTVQSYYSEELVALQIVAVSK